ncbi:MAG: efflux RND transporter periplasmic adaptor subunit [Methylotenera sp.]|nr:efflux RND transporter periplasmic adaptor subunit [Methylotenera sp.]
MQRYTNTYLPTAIALMFLAWISAMRVAMADELLTYVIKESQQAPTMTVEGSVEAVQFSTIAPQVTGNIVALPVKAGDTIKAGQLLARIDTRIAQQQVISHQAQVVAANAQLSAARQEYERKRRLHEKQYISQAALERAESDYKIAEAQAKAQLAQTGVANVQTGQHTINAPYAGLIAEVMAELGNMATPGKPLFSIYDPKALRVVVNVPQSQLAQIKPGAGIQVLIPAATEVERSLTATKVTILPTADAVSNMTKVRITLPSNLTSIRPGMFARAMLPVNNANTSVQIIVPAKAVIKRSELTAVYVVDSKGKPQLRQIRLGRKQGDFYEVFAGLQAGEEVAVDPISAANFK